MSEIAEKIGCSQQALNARFRGNPRLSSLVQIAEAYRMRHNGFVQMRATGLNLSQEREEIWRRDTGKVSRHFIFIDFGAYGVQFSSVITCVSARLSSIIRKATSACLRIIFK